MSEVLIPEVGQLFAHHPVAGPDVQSLQRFIDFRGRFDILLEKSADHLG